MPAQTLFNRKPRDAQLSRAGVQISLELVVVLSVVAAAPLGVVAERSMQNWRSIICVILLEYFKTFSLVMSSLVPPDGAAAPRRFALGASAAALAKQQTHTGRGRRHARSNTKALPRSEHFSGPPHLVLATALKWGQQRLHSDPQDIRRVPSCANPRAPPV